MSKGLAPDSRTNHLGVHVEDHPLEHGSFRPLLFRTRGEDWMLHRVDPAPEGWEPLPVRILPMLAVPGELPSEQDTV